MRIGFAEINGQAGIVGQLGAIHGLQKKMSKCQRGIARQILASLRYHHFELVTAIHDQRRLGFGADTNPVHARRYRQGAIGFYRDFEFMRMQGIDQCLVELKERLAPGENHVFFSCAGGRPLLIDHGCELAGIGVLVAQHTIRTDEIGVTETADRRGAILLSSRPQIASGKTTKHRWTSGLRALALQSVENFFDAVAQAAVRKKSGQTGLSYILEAIPSPPQGKRTTKTVPLPSGPALSSISAS